MKIACNRRPIVQTNFGNVSYALQYVDGLNEHLLKSSASTPDCVFETLTSEGLSACCHLERGGLRFLVPVTKDSTLFTLEMISLFELGII